jgi:D-aminoacyl-tRNA deacylase
MRIVLQRVKSARVDVAGETVGEIGAGYLLLLGIHTSDTAEQAYALAEKIALLRLFPDDAGKMSRSIVDTGGAVLVVSQFTLYADTSKGRRPSFIAAARPEIAIPLYEAFIEGCLRCGLPTQTGRFGADMQVTLVNDGPVTLVVEF